MKRVLVRFMRGDATPGITDKRTKSVNRSSSRIKILVFVIVSSLLSAVCVAQDSSTLLAGNHKAQKYQSFVNTKNCVTLNSGRYYIYAGNTYKNTNLSCPADKPVMYHWQQGILMLGIVSVQSGGGSSSITCCAMSHQWSSA